MLINLNLAKAQCGAPLFATGEVVLHDDIFDNVCDDGDKVCKVEVQYCDNGEFVNCKGNGSIHLKGKCYRCGEDVDVLHVFEFDENILPAGSTDDDEAYFFKGDTIDITKAVEDNLIISLPTQLLCKPDCKGLCPHCYANLNFHKCECEDDTSKSPFAVLKKLK